MMKIFPWMLRSIGSALSSEGYHQTPAQKKAARTFLDDLSRAQKNEEQFAKAKTLSTPKLMYLEMCKALRISPLISVKFDKFTNDESFNTLYFYNQGNPKSRLTAARRIAQAQFEYESRQMLNREYFTKIKASIQWQMEQIIVGSSHRFRIAPLADGKAVHHSSVASALTTVFCSLPNKVKPRFEKIIERNKTYFLDTLIQAISVRTPDMPIISAFIVCDESSSLERKVFTTVEKLKDCDYQQFLQSDIQEAFGLEGDTPLYIHSCAVQCRNGTYIHDGEFWKLPPVAERWLCTGAQPQEAILRYSTQPRSAPISREISHRIGVEVEFETVYTRHTAVRGDAGRPLTPVKVLEVTGWAICSDSSVHGGELKSPIIGFNDADEIQMAIPREIQRFINETAKADNCGGHMNYSHARLNPFQIANLISAWSFIFPLMYPDRAGNRYCVYQKPDDPNCHYQWMRVKEQCVEIRIFPFFWDVGSIAWRAKLLELMITSKQTPDLVRHDMGIGWASVKAQAAVNWNSFINSDTNSIKQHIAAAIGKVSLTQRMLDERFQNGVKSVLGFTDEMVSQAIRLEPVNI